VDTQSLKLRQAAALFRNQAFCRLWVSQFSTLTVVYGLGLAGAVLIEEKTQSSTQTSLMILSAILPAFLTSLFAGAAVDRWGRRRMLLLSHLARGVVALAFWAGTQFLSPSLALVTVYAASTTGTIFTQFSSPAELAMLPDLVEKHRLVPANALLQLSMLAAEGLGIVILSPLLIRLFGAPVVGLVGAGLYLIGANLVMSLPREPSPIRTIDPGGSTWTELKHDLRGGWQTIISDQLLTLAAIQTTVASTVLLLMLSLLPGLMSRHLGLGVENAPLLLLPGGLGFALGSALLSRWEQRLSRRATLTIGLVGLGASIGLLGLLGTDPGRLWLILPVLVGLGVTLAMVIVTARVVKQERPPAEMRGRVIAAQLAMANAAAVIPLLLGGSLADLVGIRPVMGILALVSIGSGLMGLRRRRAPGPPVGDHRDG
jgi:MFS family permease